MRKNQQFSAIKERLCSIIWRILKNNSRFDRKTWNISWNKSHTNYLWIHFAVCQNQLPQDNFTISNFHLFSIQMYLGFVFRSSFVALFNTISFRLCMWIDFECLRQKCRKLILVQFSTFKMSYKCIRCMQHRLKIDGFAP